MMLEDRSRAYAADVPCRVPQFKQIVPDKISIEESDFVDLAKRGDSGANLDRKSVV